MPHCDSQPVNLTVSSARVGSGLSYTAAAARAEAHIYTGHACQCVQTASHLLSAATAHNDVRPRPRHPSKPLCKLPVRPLPVCIGHGGSTTRAGQHPHLRPIHRQGPPWWQHVWRLLAQLHRCRVDLLLAPPQLPRLVNVDQLQVLPLARERNESRGTACPTGAAWQQRERAGRVAARCSVSNTHNKQLHSAGAGQSAASPACAMSDASLRKQHSLQIPGVCCSRPGSLLQCSARSAVCDSHHRPVLLLWQALTYGL